MALPFSLLGLPVTAPLGALGWLARQVAEAAVKEWADPARIEAAVLALAQRLERGEIDEETYDAEEARLLDELAEMRAAARAEEAP